MAPRVSLEKDMHLLRETGRELRDVLLEPGCNASVRLGPLQLEARSVPEPDGRVTIDVRCVHGEGHDPAAALRFALARESGREPVATLPEPDERGHACSEPLPGESYVLSAFLRAPLKGPPHRRAGPRLRTRGAGDHFTLTACFEDGFLDLLFDTIHPFFADALIEFQLWRRGDLLRVERVPVARVDGSRVFSARWQDGISRENPTEIWYRILFSEPMERPPGGAVS